MIAPVLTPLLTSTAVVALAEVGDKTMLLAVVLATRFRQPGRILAGILCATILNHLIAAFIGSEVSGLLDARWFRIAVALSFLAMAAWTLVPDRLDEDEAGAIRARGGAFLTTLVSFFFVEIGDKTQIATMALAARFHSVAVVAAGTTLGMMIADGPAVFLSEELVKRVSLQAARIAAALLFAGLGAWQLFEAIAG
jgi:putative Ca2+/H+ antiporter (TMEM165/GDT1 family)